VLLKKPGTQSFKMWTVDSEVKSHSAKLADGMLYNPLKGVPKEYHDFVDVFSKQRLRFYPNTGPMI
jgi:hypothetical protein